MHHPARHLLDAAPQGDAFARMEGGAHEAATSPHNDRRPPTVAQQLAGNYKKGQVRVQGLPLQIENPRGTVRSGTSPDGKTWSNRMAAHYGDILGTVGADGDPVDVFVGLFPESPRIWVINQAGPDGQGFDEHKVMVGFTSQQQATDAYLGSYDKGWKGLGSMVETTPGLLKLWLRKGDQALPFSGEYAIQQGQDVMDTAVAWTSDAMPAGMAMHHLMYELRRQDAGDELLLDAVSMADLMGDPDIEAVLTMDALVVQVNRMTLKMDQLKAVMAMAGDAVKPTQVTISDPVRARGVLQVMVLFEMSDGQTVSIWFHNPDTTPAKLTPLDELVSWKWMLNKRDVTIVVAPELGLELNIREVARRIMRLVQRNSEAFVRANARAAERTAQIASLQTEISTLETELGGLQKRVEVAKLADEDKPKAWRGGAPAFQMRDGKVVITNWETGDPIADFSGVAYDYKTGKFVLTEIENGERTFNSLQAKTFAAAVPEAEALKEANAAKAEQARWAKTKADGKALVLGFIEDHGGVLSAWDDSRLDQPGAWEYATLRINSQDVKISVSDGGVVQVNGNPFSPARVMNTVPEAVEASILAAAPAPSAEARAQAEGQAAADAARRTEEDAVLSSLGVTAEDIAGISDDGGYGVVVDSPALSLKWQDVLDAAWQRRIVDVRNALRALGWQDDANHDLVKGGGKLLFMPKHVGAGRNVVGGHYEIAGVTGFFMSDTLQLTSPEMAGKIDSGLVSSAAAPSAAPAPAEPAAGSGDGPGNEPDPIAAVDAAYRFDDATPDFKSLLADSLTSKSYSPFVSARQIDERAKALGLTVSWSLAAVVLDAVRTVAVLDDATGAYMDKPRDAIAATGALVRYFRDFIRSDKELAKDPTDGWGSVMGKADAQRILTQMIDIAINRKSGTTLTAAQEDEYADYVHDARVINDYLHGRIRNSGARNLLRVPDMKAKYPEIDNQPMFDDVAALVQPYIQVAASVPPPPDASKPWPTSWLGFKVVDQAFVEEGQAFVQNGGVLALPSAQKISGQVYVNLRDGDGETLKVAGVVVGVSFTASKVRYSVAVAISPDPKEGTRLYAVVHDIDSELVEPIATVAPEGLMDSVDEAVGARLAAVGATERAQVVLDFVGDVTAAVTQLEIALDVVVTNEPINRAAGNIEQADLELTNAAQFRRAIAVLSGEVDRLFDDVGEGGEEAETCLGLIKRDGEVIGRAVVLDGDGKAMVYLGAAGTKRVTFVSPVDAVRRTPMWSDEDTGNLVDMLVENLGAAAAPAPAPAVEMVPAATEAEGRLALRALAGFMARSQRKTIEVGMAGEEKQFFFDKMIELKALIDGMPETYEQDGLAGKAVVYLHYFRGGADWWIVEKDKEPEQEQAYGQADLGHGPELGYISIVELIAQGVELDLHWTPKTLDEIRGVVPEQDASAPAAAAPAADDHIVEGSGVVETPSAAVPQQASGQAPLGDISYRAVDDMFTAFYPDSQAGEEAWAVINSNPETESGKVFTAHAQSVIEQLRAAGYTVTEAPPLTIDDDVLAAELAAPANADDRAYLATLINGTADMLDPGILDRLEPMFTTYADDADMMALLTQAAEAYSNAAVAAAKAALAG